MAYRLKFDSVTDSPLGKQATDGALSAGTEGAILDILRRRPLHIAVVQQAVGELQTHAVVELNSAGDTVGKFRLEIDGRIHEGWRYAAGDKVYVRLAGRTHVVQLPGFGDGSAATGASQDEIRADMPGVVIAAHCNAGDAVQTGDKILTVESMKLQVSLVAPRDAVIAKMHLPPESSFERGALLISLAPESASSGHKK